jgi:hypothetical protein
MIIKAEPCVRITYLLHFEGFSHKMHRIHRKGEEGKEKGERRCWEKEG